MQIKVLGVAGGIDADSHTTAFLLDDDTLIDAGTGVCSLPVAAQQGIHQVFLTHAHLDHLAGLPLLLEAALHFRAVNRLPPIKVYAHAQALQDLRQHIFNGRIWPDFTRLPCAAQPVLDLVPIEIRGQIMLSDGRSVEAVHAEHGAPAFGFAVRQCGDVWLFTGDTGPNPMLWQYIDRLPQQGQRLRWLVADCSFADDKQHIADQTGHYTPQSLAQDMMEHLHNGDFELYLGHLKPGDKHAIARNLGALRQAAQTKGCQVHLLQQGHVFLFDALQVKAAA